ncbi:MAG: hypothetical protein NTX71_09650 [Candidatus Aureabacteria bacterium]|nr:hypothetical protein [Candidatus Auribacterota bacterium]
MFALLCVGGAGFSIGKTSALPALIIGGTFSAQSQLGTVPVVIAVACASSSLFIWNRRKSKLCFARAEKITISLCLLFLAIAWAPPVIEELLYEDGNITKLYNFSAYPEERGDQWTRAFQQLYKSLNFPFRTIMDTADKSNMRGCFFISIPIIAIALGLTTRQRFIRALTGICLLVTLASIFSWTRVRGKMNDYIFFYYQVVIALLYSIGMLTILFNLLEYRLINKYRKATVFSICSAIVTGTIVYLIALQPSLEDSIDKYSYIDELYSAINPSKKLTYKLIWEPGGEHNKQWATAAGLAYRLKKEGHSCCVSNDCFGFGRDMYPPNIANVKPLLLFNANVSQEEIDKIPFNIKKDVVSGPTRLLICEVPSISLPLVIRHDSSDAYFSGFGPPVRTHRWAGRSHAAIEFFLGESPKEDDLYKITLVFISFEPQDIKLSINGNRLCQSSLERRLYKWELRVPNKTLNLQGHNTFQIDLLKAQQLKGWNKEILGIGFIELKIQRYS